MCEEINKNKETEELKEIEEPSIFEEFFKLRIYQLVKNTIIEGKPASESELSQRLGHSHGYLNNITNGKSLPKFREFLYICEYFKITPAEFFDEGIEDPVLLHRAITGLKKLNEEDLEMITNHIERLLK